MLRKLIIIAGPTAVGKTALAIKIAKKVDGQIISADSRQIYRLLDIGTAKPTAAERAEVAHHGLDLMDPDQAYSAGAFCRYAREVAARLWQAGTVPVVVGGTGLYIQAFLDGLWHEPAAPVTTRERLHTRATEQGVEVLHAELAQIDPAQARQIRATDTQRVLRALELAQPNLRAPAQGWDPFPCQPLAVCLFRAREVMNQRIDDRVGAMFAQGMVEEVEALRARGYTRSARALQSLGYAELLGCLEGSGPLDEALAMIRLRTRQYAKRQLTWFRRDRRFRWLDLDRWGTAGTVERVLAEFRNHKGL